MKHNEMSNQLLFRQDDVDGRARVTTEERVLRERLTERRLYMKVWRTASGASKPRGE